MGFWKNFIKSMDLNSEEIEKNKLPEKNRNTGSQWFVSISLFILALIFSGAIPSFAFPVPRLVGLIFFILFSVHRIYMYYNKETPAERGKIEEKKQKFKEERKQKYLKKFRVWKLTIGEWIAIIILATIVLGLISLYI
jgi:uncharacterized protein (DUF58 family)